MWGSINNEELNFIIFLKGGKLFMINSESVSVLDQLKKISSSLSPKLRKLAEYVAGNYVKSAFMNAATLAYNSGVSESTVTRFVAILGYSGYSDFQSACQAMVQNHISTLEKYPLDASGKSSLDIYRQVMSMEAQMLSRASEIISKDVMDTIVDLIYEASDVVIVGTVANVCLAEYANYFLSILGPNVHKITRLDIESLMKIRKMPPKTVAMVFSFPRYSKPTQDILEYLKAKEIPIIGFTDSVASPIIPFIKYPLIIPQQYITFIDPFGAVMALIHALFTGVYLKDKDASQNKVKQFDSYCKSQNFLIRKEINVVDLI
ncbi:MurR/RpiR family transcriptional regulator [Aminobacterium colombiense]|nr:MurR/RpiR family transcriptional regulator [Aminobacterium colombiense]